jgi:hypothetical protein
MRGTPAPRVRRELLDAERYDERHEQQQADDLCHSSRAR